MTEKMKKILSILPLYYYNALIDSSNDSLYAENEGFFGKEHRTYDSLFVLPDKKMIALSYSEFSTTGKIRNDIIQFGFSSDMTDEIISNFFYLQRAVRIDFWEKNEIDIILPLCKITKEQELLIGKFIRANKSICILEEPTGFRDTEIVLLSSEFTKEEYINVVHKHSYTSEAE